MLTLGMCAYCLTHVCALVIFQIGKGTHTATLESLSPFAASWEALVATAGFASKSWSERATGEVWGVAVS
eukprot:7806305-Pyramimonas_sp.AAC.1